MFVHKRTRLFPHTCTSARRVAPGRGQHAGPPHRRNNIPTLNRTLPLFQYKPTSLSVPYSLTMPSNPSTKTSRSKPSLLQMRCTRVRCTDDSAGTVGFVKYTSFVPGTLRMVQPLYLWSQVRPKRPSKVGRFVFVWRQGQEQGEAGRTGGGPGCHTSRDLMSGWRV